MNDREVEALRSKYKEIVNSPNADDVPIRRMNEVVDAYNKGRADAERDFQNSDYWNDYLAKVIADARADEREKVINEFLKELFVSDNYKDWHSICVIAERLKEQNNG